MQPWLHSVVGLHRPAAVGMLVATERGQQRGAQRDEEDHEEGARGPAVDGEPQPQKLGDSKVPWLATFHYITLNIS